MNKYSVCIKDYQNLEIKGDLGVSTNTLDLVFFVISKCKKNCASDREINNYIDKLKLNRIAIQENIDFNIRGKKPV